jgi:NADH dehydrogenase FAD-containing subunit
VLLFDGGSAPLAAFGPKLSAMAARDLSKLGVELHMGSIVTAADPQSLQMFDKPFRYHDLVTPPTYPAGEPSSLRSS